MAVNFVAWHDRDTANHKVEIDKAAAQGYRTVSLSVYGERNDPRYAAVMVKRPVVHAEQQFFGLNFGQFQQVFNQLSAQGFGPYIVTATGPANDPVIAASFRAIIPTPLTRHGINTQELSQLNLQAWRSGLIPAWIDAYGTAGDVRYIAVWHPNTARIPWNLDAVSDPTDLATRQARFNAIVAQGGRPTFVAMTPENKFFGLFVDNAVGRWTSRTHLTSGQYQQEFNTLVANGQAPIYVAAQGAGPNARFNAIFTDQEEPIARIFTTSGSPTVAGIDSAMEKFMKDHSIRGCALAITQGTRLVYAKGYTWAEPTYPQVQPTTVFRLASVSKVFVAAAIYRLVQQGVPTPDGQPFTLNTTMQSVLQLKTPKGENPADSRFKDITIHHLLESTSSLDQGLVWWHVEAAAAFGSALPCTPSQLASFCASLKLGTKNPGDTTNVVYGNADYFMLSQVVARLANAATFEEALTQRILTPLGIKRIRGSRSLQAAQAADEARYHITNINPEPKSDKPSEFTDYPPSLWVVPSSQSNDRPLVPHQYGGDNYEVLDGCGGLSGAVTDIARLVAAFSLRSNNPVFTEATLDTWFQNTVNATGFSGPDDHGLHGFDWGARFNVNQPISVPGNFITSKGGWLPSHSSVLTFTAGGLGFVAVANGVGQADVKTDWYSDLNGDGHLDANSVLGIAQAHNWGTTDLFPQYGIPSWVTASTTNVLAIIDPSKLSILPRKLHSLNLHKRDIMMEQQLSAAGRGVPSLRES